MIHSLPWITIFCHSWSDSVNIFTSDEVTRENHCRIASLVTNLAIHGNSCTILYIFSYPVESIWSASCLDDFHWHIIKIVLWSKCTTNLAQDERPRKWAFITFVFPKFYYFSIRLNILFAKIVLDMTRVVNCLSNYWHKLISVAPTSFPGEFMPVAINWTRYFIHDCIPYNC